MNRRQRAELRACLVVIVVLACAAMGAICFGQEKKEVAIVCFTATWCENCPSQKAVVEKTAEMMKVPVLWVDVDKERSIATAYNVTGVPHTLVCIRQPKANSTEKILVPKVRVIGISNTQKMSEYVTQLRGQ